MIHAKNVIGRWFPHDSARAPEQIDRAQEMGGDFTQAIEKLYEIGRTLKLGDRKPIPTNNYTLRQYEYGNVKDWRALGNLADPGSGEDTDVTLEDMASKKVDVGMYVTDEATNTFKGSIWVPTLRVSGFTINIGDPEAAIERNFTLVGENYKIFTGKYLAYQTATAVGDGEQTITLSPAAVEYASGDYILRVIRVRSGVQTELTEDTSSPYTTDTWRYSTGDVIIQGGLTSDVHKVYYISSTAYETLWSDNDSDLDAIYADQCTIYLSVDGGDDSQIYRLQSVSIDASLDRTDEGQIGDKDKVQYGVNDKTVNVQFNRKPNSFTVEETLRGTSAYPYIDLRNLSTNVTLRVKMYTDNTKTTFLCGYKVTGLTLNTHGTTQAIQAYGEFNTQLQSDNFMFSPTESEIDA